MYIYCENMSKPTLVDGSPVTTRSPLTSRSMNELAPAKSDTVPLTPEILNSVMAMTNPLEYSFSTNHSTSAANDSEMLALDSLSNDSGSSFESSVTSLGNSTEVTTPTAQQTCSELIKTSLKLSLEMKRKSTKYDTSPKSEERYAKKMKAYIDSSDEEIIPRSSRKSSFILTAEDEDRRRRRRERNKIAATKCRMKKRERTINLISEAEILETQNIDLKAQVCSLEIERRSLTDMLQSHTTSCVHSEALELPLFESSTVQSLNDINITDLDRHANMQSYQKSHKTKSRSSSNRIPSISKLNSHSQLKQKCNMSKNTRSKPMENTLDQILISEGNMTTSTINVLPPIDINLSSDVMDCKTLIPDPSDAYSVNTFLKDSVDMDAALPTIIDSDYIPNCNSAATPIAVQQNVFDQSGFGIADNNNTDGMEFILKSEMVDTNDSPYTTVQSADRFLFDGVNETFGADIEPTSNSIQPYVSSHIDMNGFKENLHLHHLNNNNNSIAHSCNNNNEHFSTNMSHGVDTINNLTVISSVHSHTIHSPSEPNSSCQSILSDNSLLKSDFLSPNCELLSVPTNESCGSHFTTDLDSGLITYTSNNNGCLA